MNVTTAAAYRRPLFDPQDVLFRRCLFGASIAGAALLGFMISAPVRHTEMIHLAQLPPRFARLIVEPAPAALPVLPPGDATHEPHRGGTGNGRPAGGGDVRPPGPAGPAAGTPDGGPRDRASGPGGPGGPAAGAAGRARAQAELGGALGGAGGSLNSALAGLSDALGTSDAGAAPVPAGRGGSRVIRAARSEGQLAVSAAGYGGGSGGATADLGHSVVVGSLVAMGGGGGDGTGGGGGGGNGGARGVPGGIGLGGVGNGTGGGGAGGSGNGPGGGTGTGGRGGAAGPGVYRSNASLLAVIQKYAAGIQYCYGNELKHDPSLRGKLVVAITVDAAGDVLQATVVENSVGSRALTDCALSQIRSWHFTPIPEGVTAFQAPFVFTPPR